MARMKKRAEREYESSSDSGFDLSSESDSEEALSTDSDSDYSPSKAPKKNSPKKALTPRKPKTAESTIAKPIANKASVSVLAVNPEESNAAKDSVSHIEQSVIGRILKALNLANHTGTGEPEAKAALRMAYKLMSQHSVTQAAVLATVEDKNEKLQKAGQSTVTVRSQSGKALREGTWAQTNNNAKNRMDFVFYGLAEQTVAAAYAFEMVYNSIMTWRAEKKTAKGVHGKNSYCHGVADGVRRLARDEKAREERDAHTKEQKRLEHAKKEEEAERQHQIERLADQHPEPELVVKAKAEEGRPVDRRPKVEEVDDDDVLKVPSNTHDTHVKAEPVDRRPKVEEVVDDDVLKDTACSQVKTEPDAGPSSTPRRCPSPLSDGEGDNNIVDFDDGAGYWGNGHDDILQADFNDSDNDDPLDLDAAEPKVKVKQEEPASIASAASASAEVHPLIKDEPQDESPWDSAKQLVEFRETTAALADDFLKQQGIKLHKGRKHIPLRFKDKDAKRIYKQGREDAKKIDVKRRRIMEAEEDLVY